MSLSVLGEAVMRELKRDALLDNRQPCLDQDDDVTNAPDPLSNPQSRRTPTEFTMSLETDIPAAYEEQEAVETAARELEARIRRVDGAARLMPAPTVNPRP